MTTALYVFITVLGLAAGVRIWQVRSLVLRLQQVRQRNTNPNRPTAKG
jgi:hypothetical protein